MKKHAGGRPPTKIEDILPPDWKDRILAMSAEGCSDVEIRAKLCTVSAKGQPFKFSHDIWYALIEREQEFAETIQKAKVLCQAWWERIARENLYHSKLDVFETGSWYANMKNRFGWRDQAQVEVHNHFTSVLQQLRAVREHRDKTQIKPRPAVAEALSQVSD